MVHYNTNISSGFTSKKFGVNRSNHSNQSNLAHCRGGYSTKLKVFAPMPSCCATHDSSDIASNDANNQLCTIVSDTQCTTTNTNTTIDMPTLGVDGISSSVARSNIACDRSDDTVQSDKFSFEACKKQLENTLVFRQCDSSSQINAVSSLGPVVSVVSSSGPILSSVISMSVGNNSASSSASNGCSVVVPVTESSTFIANTSLFSVSNSSNFALGSSCSVEDVCNVVSSVDTVVSVCVVPSSSVSGRLPPTPPLLPPSLLNCAPQQRTLLIPKSSVKLLTKPLGALAHNIPVTCDESVSVANTQCVQPSSSGLGNELVLSNASLTNDLTDGAFKAIEAGNALDPSQAIEVGNTASDHCGDNAAGKDDLQSVSEHVLAIQSAPSCTLSTSNAYVRKSTSSGGDNFISQSCPRTNIMVSSSSNSNVCMVLTLPNCLTQSNVNGSELLNSNSDSDSVASSVSNVLKAFNDCIDSYDCDRHHVDVRDVVDVHNNIGNVSISCSTTGINDVDSIPITSDVSVNSNTLSIGRFGDSKFCGNATRYVTSAVIRANAHLRNNFVLQLDRESLSKYNDSSDYITLFGFCGGNPSLTFDIDEAFPYYQDDFHRTLLSIRNDFKCERSIRIFHSKYFTFNNGTEFRFCVISLQSLLCSQYDESAFGCLLKNAFGALSFQDTQCVYNTGASYGLKYCGGPFGVSRGAIIKVIKCLSSSHHFSDVLNCVTAETDMLCSHDNTCTRDKSLCSKIRANLSRLSLVFINEFIHSMVNNSRVYYHGDMLHDAVFYSLYIMDVFCGEHASKSLELKSVAANAALCLYSIVNRVYCDLRNASEYVANKNYHECKYKVRVGTYVLRAIYLNETLCTNSVVLLNASVRDLVNKFCILISKACYEVVNDIKKSSFFSNGMLCRLKKNNPNVTFFNAFSKVFNGLCGTIRGHQLCGAAAAFMRKAVIYLKGDEPILTMSIPLSKLNAYSFLVDNSDDDSDINRNMFISYGIISSLRNRGFEYEYDNNEYGSYDLALCSISANISAACSVGVSIAQGYIGIVKLLKNSVLFMSKKTEDTFNILLSQIYTDSVCTSGITDNLLRVSYNCLLHNICLNLATAKILDMYRDNSFALPLTKIGAMVDGIVSLLPSSNVIDEYFSDSGLYLSFKSSESSVSELCDLLRNKAAILYGSNKYHLRRVYDLDALCSSCNTRDYSVIQAALDFIYILSSSRIDNNVLVDHLKLFELILSTTQKLTLLYNCNVVHDQACVSPGENQPIVTVNDTDFFVL